MDAKRATLIAIAMGAFGSGAALAQVAVGAISGVVSTNRSISGYVAILDLRGGSFTPVVSPLSIACSSAGQGTVSLLPTGTFAANNATLLAITANAGPAISGAACGFPAGLIVSDGNPVNPGQAAGPVLYFTGNTRAAITSGPVPEAVKWAVAGTTNTDNDCSPPQLGTLLVSAGRPGACAIPKSAIPAGRGAAGLDRSGNLLIVAVVEGDDGAGLETRDFAYLLMGLGAENAVNFDGGGSTVFYWTPSKTPPVQSPLAARSIQNAKFPASQPNPNKLSFTVTLLDPARKYVYDKDGRSIYASIGFVYSRP